jgi:hypothetical protein
MIYSTFTCSDVLANRTQAQKKWNSSKSKKSRQKRTWEEVWLWYFGEKKEKLFKFYTGITVNQFNHLFSVLEKVGNVYELRYWKGKKTKSPKKRRKKN